MSGEGAYPQLFWLRVSRSTHPVPSIRSLLGHSRELQQAGGGPFTLGALQGVIRDPTHIPQEHV